MCERSRQVGKSRLAKSGETLVLQSFPGYLGGCSYPGFVSPNDPCTLVCVRDQTRLELSGISRELQTKFGIETSTADAVFRELTRVPERDIDAIQIGRKVVSLSKLGKTGLQSLRAEVLPTQKQVDKIRKFVDSAVITKPTHQHAGHPF